MFDDLDDDDVGYSDEFSQSTNFVGGRYDEKLDDAIRLNEARQAVVDSGYSQFCMPAEDWMLD